MAHRIVATGTKIEPVAEGAEQLTIDELARETGMTVRNVRAYQSRGLLPPPEVRGRTGYYDAEHVARLRLIQEMQAEGFNLTAIERLLERSNGAGSQILDFGRVALGSFAQEVPEFATGDDLGERLGAPFDERTARKATKLGLVRPLGDGRFEIPSPTLMRAGEELVSLGIPLSHALAVAEQIERHSRAIAQAFVRLFMTDVVGSAEVSERSADEWARLRQALEQLGPLATEAVHAGFQQTMSRAVERQIERMLDR
ncbi:MAG TPA: MerR family transcriptional regulator [Solirubrobacteraceae bacterium]|nr:MerR family transcriptional regulator [Solirubrobacteraceae bacterium]